MKVVFHPFPALHQTHAPVDGSEINTNINSEYGSPKINSKIVIILLHTKIKIFKDTTFGKKFTQKVKTISLI